MILRKPLTLAPGVQISIRMIGWTYPRLLTVDGWPTPGQDPAWVFVKVSRAPVTDMRPEEVVPEHIRLHRDDMVEVCIP